MKPNEELDAAYKETAEKRCDRFLDKLAKLSFSDPAAIDEARRIAGELALEMFALGRSNEKMRKRGSTYPDEICENAAAALCDMYFARTDEKWECLHPSIVALMLSEVERMTNKR